MLYWKRLKPILPGITALVFCKFMLFVNSYVLLDDVFMCFTIFYVGMYHGSFTRKATCILREITLPLYFVGFSGLVV